MNMNKRNSLGHTRAILNLENSFHDLLPVFLLSCAAGVSCTVRIFHGQKSCHGDPGRDCGLIPSTPLIVEGHTLLPHGLKANTDMLGNTER